ncbi:hypothetical protein GCM10010168_41020 [Actinoplanes ianthinogenes]|uniref:Uncharacterized protein n=1 Tax=Actinoplanes ianthinogenes TaxID=122358 RepID=A0ABN6CEN1_9ACTN|nr:hypothetical protein [Actinoplanes ianthinogenes]BCJ43588.1 hypothetical protein Aiant_42450 [Actinoplanes ianthinogenes]GGR19027.1 hypothetical protein GCM10010168_41020 [Actinoplanes ianthinogenes]
MSRQFRNRVAALVASGLIFGVPLIATGTASADQLQPGDRRVTFGGGMLGLSCDSKPSVEKLTVPAESTLHVINRTGHDARLELAGARKGVIPDDGAAEVVFRRGTTPVVLTPDCADPEDPVPMLVTAVPSASATLPDPAPGDSGATSVPSIVAGSSSLSSATGSAVPDTRSRPMRHSADAARRRTDTRQPATRAAADTTATTPRDSTSQKIKNKDLRTTTAGAPPFAGMPPGERKALVPADRASVTGVTTADATTPAAAAAPVQDLDSPITAPAAEPVAAVEPMRTARPIGLLGLTALVCVLGVLTAAIRAFVSQRASRANLA